MTTPSAPVLCGLVDAFRAGYPTAPPLLHATLSGFIARDGATSALLDQPSWDLLLKGEGLSWRPYLYPASTDPGDVSPYLQCCYVTDDPNHPSLKGQWRHFHRLAATADALLSLPGSTGLAERWLDRLHGLGERSKLPTLRTLRYRFLRHPRDTDTIIRVEHPPHELFPGVPEFANTEPDAFPHGELSILPDVFLASAAALSAVADERQPPLDTPVAITPRYVEISGFRFELTRQFREMLSYIWGNPGKREADLIKHFGFTDSNHLHSRLSELRKRVRKELDKRRAGFRLEIASQDRAVSARVVRLTDPPPT